MGGKDVSRRDGLLPDYESLQEVYSRLGWKIASTGRVIPPDPHKLLAGKRKSRHPSSKHRRKLQTSSSDGLLLHRAEPILKAEFKSAPHERTKPQQAQGKTAVRNKISRTMLREKVATAVHAALEQECLAMLSSLGEKSSKRMDETPHVPSAQYMPIAQSSLRKQSSAPNFATAKRAQERARGGR